MLSTTYIANAIFAVGIFTIYMAIMHVFRSGTMKKKVRDVAVSFQPGVEEEEGESAWAVFAESTLKALKVDDSGKKEIGIMLSRAGITSENAVTFFLFFRYVVQPIFLVLALHAMIQAVFGSHENMYQVSFQLFKSFLFTVLGLRGTQIYVENCRQKRQQALLQAFPEVLDLILVCIESGLGLDAALNRVCKEMRSMYPDIISELDRTRLELTMLGDRVVALQNLGERADIVPFKTLVSALIQTEKFGTSLVDTLRVLAEEMRTTRLFSAEQKAARIPVLITLPLIICILPAFIMIIVAPPMVKVMSQGGVFGKSAAFSTKNGR
ncbi:MAG: type II secretion system F family protein [Proteobacteria bacterium]|nr:type II secretion system F family protein [Pseudomonadota bacterium]